MGRSLCAAAPRPEKLGALSVSFGFILRSLLGLFCIHFGSNLGLFWVHFLGLAKKSTFEDAGGAKGSQTELQLSPRGAQRRAKGAKREPKGLPTGATFANLFVRFAGFVLGLFF